MSSESGVSKEATNNEVKIMAKQMAHDMLRSLKESQDQTQAVASKAGKGFEEEPAWDLEKQERLRLSQPRLDDLPGELLLMILDRLDARSLAKARRVSKTWNRLSEDQIVAGKYYIILDEEATEEVVISTISARPSLLSVTMDSLHLTHKVLDAMLHHPALRNLHVVEREGVPVLLSFAQFYRMIYRKKMEARHAAELGKRWMKHRRYVGLHLPV